MGINFTNQSILWLIHNNLSLNRNDYTQLEIEMINNATKINIDKKKKENKKKLYKLLNKEAKE